jgi:nitrogen regulatory protein PII 1
MKMVQAIIRPEKVAGTLAALEEAGLRGVTHSNVLGRGKQQGLKVGSIYYDEIPKDSIFIVVEDEDADRTAKIIIEAARSGREGTYGDGKIFVLPVDRVFTVSSGEEKL